MWVEFTSNGINVYKELRLLFNIFQYYWLIPATRTHNNPHLILHHHGSVIELPGCVHVVCS